MTIRVRLQLNRADFTLDVDAQFPLRGVSAVFGASGSGKTTLLRCIAGLERAVGVLQVNGEIWQDETLFMPVHQRPLGYVFQEASLFPHLSVRANLEYGYKRIAPAARRVRLEQVVEWLGLRPLLDRRDTVKLSGGERQRVAIGRALLASPRLLLMDEPLSALDASSKQEILPYLEALHRELEIPVVYVSHALEEVARLADHLLLLEQGKLIANGPLQEVLARLDLPTAHREDAGVVVEATIAEHDDAYRMTRLTLGENSLWTGHLDPPLGTLIRVRIMARDVSISVQPPHPSSISNILKARITEMQAEGCDKVNVRLSVGQSEVVIARITRRSRDLLQLSVGMAVFAQIKSVALT